MSDYYMKSSELRQKSIEELYVLEVESRNKLRDMRFDMVEGKVKNIREVRNIKKTIAQTLTILRERKITH